MTRSAHDAEPCSVPLVPFTWAGIRRPVHEGIADQLAAVRRDWEALGGQRWYEIRQWWGYAPRDCTGASWHERGVAVDINPRENPMVHKQSPCPSDMPPRLVEFFTTRGFGWGGNWNSKCDAMHFSKGPNEGGDGQLYVVESLPAAVDEELEMFVTTDENSDTGNSRTVPVPPGARRLYFATDHEPGAEVRLAIGSGRDGWRGPIEKTELQPAVRHEREIPDWAEIVNVIQYAGNPVGWSFGR